MGFLRKRKTLGEKIRGWDFSDERETTPEEKAQYVAEKMDENKAVIISTGVLVALSGMLLEWVADHFEAGDRKVLDKGRNLGKD
jgi:hypothetical protein